MPYPPEFLDSLAGKLTLLPHTAAANALRRAYNERQKGLGLTAWQSPSVLSWGQFLENLWSEAIVSGAETRMLLNTLQEHVIWLEVIAAKPPDSTMVSSDSLANLAAEAWGLAHAYDIVNRLGPAAQTHDSRVFAQWASLFARECGRQGYITAAELPFALAKLLREGAIPAPQQITLFGFREHSPAAATLLAALRANVTDIRELHFPDAKPARYLIEADTEIEEIRAAATRMRSLLEANPQTQISVIVPDLSQMSALDGALREVLAPELQDITADSTTAPWEFPSQGPLSKQPIIATALDLLRLVFTDLPLGNIKTLLISPHLSAADDSWEAARFDATLFQNWTLLRTELDLPTLSHISQASERAPQWIGKLSRWLDRSPLKGQKYYAEWAETTRSILREANWATGRTPASLEFQAREAFDGALDQLSTLDFHGKRVDFAKFLDRLTRQCSQEFVPVSTRAPIQFLSFHAATSQCFDHLFLLRATDANYPSATFANPLISFPLQAEQRMPGTDPQRTTAEAREQLTLLLQSANDVTFSFARHVSSGEQQFAPMLQSIASPQLLHNAALEAPPRVALVPTKEPPVPSLPFAEVKGGASVLKLQAACGFLAFAALRLRSDQIETITTGFDALESGDVLHKTMEYFWRDVKSQETLRRMSEEERIAKLTTCIDQAMPPNLIAGTEWDAAYLNLQKTRLRNVLRAWMEHELKRAPFTVVGREKKMPVQVGPLELQVRIDRVDQLDVGGTVLVDYKTGASVSPKQWEGERPDDPQLPLYALLADPEELKGIAFARLRMGKDMKWFGIQSEEGILPPRRDSVTDISYATEQWHEVLDRLATDFANGIATVNPKDVAVNCKDCVQRLLCRIRPELFFDPESDEDETGDEAS